MPINLLETKFFIPRHETHSVSRSGLTARLDAGLSRKLTLICAPAGFGKSSLVSEWIDHGNLPCAWVSLDATDKDPYQFLSYVVAAIQKLNLSAGAAAWALLQASPPAPPESVLTMLINKVTNLASRFVLVLDDYHLVSSKAVDDTLAFFIDHLPSQIHLVLATREEPALSLARIRAQGQLSELRQEDLRFGLDEVNSFFNTSMALKLSNEQIAVLSARTEGWIAGLQLAAISLHGEQNPEQFIQSFNGSNRFFQDFLLEEVLLRQPQHIQSFLLRTSILERMCAPLCDALMQSKESQSTLTYLEQANLFIIPLDTERRWFRYHHLFAELLRQRLARQEGAALFQLRASEWYESNHQPVEAFQQALAANDIERTIRIIDCNGMPLYFQGAMAPIIAWLQSQPNTFLDSHPRLWVILSWSLMLAGYPKQAEVKLQSAVIALTSAAPDLVPQDLWGQVATLNAWVAVAHHDVQLIAQEGNRALALLDSDNRAVRIGASCVLAIGHQFAGNRSAAKHAYVEVIAAGESAKNFMFTMVASMGLASIQLIENQFHLAARTYFDLLERITNPTHLMACEVHLGLARIFYEWNDLETANYHAQLSSTLGEPLECGAALSADVIRARILFLREGINEANTLLNQTGIAAQNRNFNSRMAEVVGAQCLALLRRGYSSAALDLARQYKLSIPIARALLAQGNAVEALAAIEPYRKDMAEKTIEDELLKSMVVQALILDAMSMQDDALQMLSEALVTAQRGGFVRTFVEEGEPMAKLLAILLAQGFMPDYIDQLMAAWDGAPLQTDNTAALLSTSAFSMVEPLSQRELDILQLIKQGDSNQRIGEKLFLSLSTVKWHNQNIFNKLQVKRRTEAVARALTLNLLHH